MNARRPKKMPPAQLVPVPEPPADASEREKAIFWRVNVMGLTQEKLAELLNVRRSTIWRYESGEQPMTTMYRMACLGVMSWRAWSPKYWPYVGNRKEENETFKRSLKAAFDEKADLED